MTTIFGEIKCPGCHISTRFAEEIALETTEKLILLGSAIEESLQGVFKSVELAPCDYCQTEFSIYAHIVKGMVSAFTTEADAVITNQATKNCGLEQEKNKRVNQFNETFTLDFNEQPYLPGTKLKYKQTKWTVSESYKKENVETDVLVRTEINTTDEYWYKVKSGEVEKWIQVVEAPNQNAKLTMEPPVIKTNEVLLTVEDRGARSEIMFVKQTDEFMTLTAIQMLSGTVLLLQSTQEDGRVELEANIFGKSLEEALSQFEMLYAQDGLEV